MKFKLPKPINDTQRTFAELCEKGGGVKGGPARTKVQALLKESGQQLNKLAEAEVAEHFKELSDRNPWHLCFAIGLCWGHLAKFEIDFTDAATRVLEDFNDGDLKIARKFHYERGAQPIEDLLRGGYTLFQKVPLPPGIAHRSNAPGTGARTMVVTDLSSINKAEIHQHLECDCYVHGRALSQSAARKSAQDSSGLTSDWRPNRCRLDNPVPNARLE